MQKQFTQAINQICEEKNLPKEVVMETVEAALASAYKKDYGSRDQEVRVEIDGETGHIQVFVIKEVVDEVEDDKTQISVVNAHKIKKGVKVGDTVEILDIPADFGRIAAQTAKQVIIQRIREAEREIVFEEFKDREGDIVNGIVQRVEGDTVIIDLGKATGVLYRSEQINGEHYYTGQRIKIYVARVDSEARGPQIILSRAHPELIKKLFETEVPEIMAGTIEVKSIAREPGERTKIAVSTDQEGIDPVGALVGQRGSRVQSVMNEVGDEKIDVILWNPDIKVYITNALSPAKVIDVVVDEKEKKATVKVPEDQLSLAIGKRGQNVRLAAKLTGWNVDIAGADDAGIEATAVAVKPETKKVADIEDSIIKSIESQNADEEQGVAEEPKAEEQAPEAAEEVKGDKKTKEVTVEEAPKEDQKKEAKDDLIKEVEESAANTSLEEEMIKGGDVEPEKTAIESQVNEETEIRPTPEEEVSSAPEAKEESIEEILAEEQKESEKKAK